jgi:hypothetical protein
VIFYSLGLFYCQWKDLQSFFMLSKKTLFWFTVFDAASDYAGNALRVFEQAFAKQNHIFLYCMFIFSLHYIACIANFTF